MNVINCEDAIFDQLDRLGCSINQHPYSGLATKLENLVAYDDKQNLIPVVKIFDDYTDGIYNGVTLLEYLKTLQTADIVSDSVENIWLLISEFTV